MYRILRTDPVTVVQIFEREVREGLEGGTERRGREGHAEDAEKGKRVWCGDLIWRVKAGDPKFNLVIGESHEVSCEAVAGFVFSAALGADW